jgi:hypothetical protein
LNRVVGKGARLMAKGKKIIPPKIVVVHSANPRFASRDEAWEVAGPILARLIAQTILAEQRLRKRKNV